MSITEERLIENGKYFLSINFKHESNDKINEYMCSEEINIWVFSYDIKNLCERFPNGAEHDIKKIYNKYYKKDITASPIHYISADLDILTTILPDLKENDFPIIFMTKNNEMIYPVILNDIKV